MSNKRGRPKKKAVELSNEDYGLDFSRSDLSGEIKKLIFTGVNPVDICKAKWRYVLHTHNFNEVGRSQNCALCVDNNYADLERKACKSCPLARVSVPCADDGSPFHKCVKARKMSDKLRYAQEMYDNLCKLSPDVSGSSEDKVFYEKIAGLERCLRDKDRRLKRIETRYSYLIGSLCIAGVSLIVGGLVYLMLHVSSFLPHLPGWGYDSSGDYVWMWGGDALGSLGGILLFILAFVGLGACLYCLYLVFHDDSEEVE